MNYRPLGLLAFLLLFCGLAFIVWRWPQGKQLSFSQHVATHRYRIIYYAILFGLTLPLLVLFFLKWFVPVLGLSAWFSSFIVVSCLTQFLCTLIPETGGRKTRYHRWLAGISALCLLPPLALLLAAHTVTPPSKIIAGSSLLAMLGIIYVAARTNGKHDAFLILQIGYFAAFFAPILFISYL